MQFFILKKIYEVNLCMMRSSLELGEIPKRNLLHFIFDLIFYCKKKYTGKIFILVKPLLVKKTTTSL